MRNWKDIRKAYLFLALTVGMVTPLVAILVLSAPIDFKAHEGDLVTHYATMINGVPFGMAVAALASFTLMMAVNTAFVASSELLERVAHRYGFHWLIATNRRHSLYRIHLASAIFFSLIILLTMGSQEELANMYALGLVASFCINMGSLILYRYFKGTAEGMTYYTSRLGTLILWIILVSCFIFLAIDKPHATMLWAGVTGLMLLLGFLVARKRAPEIKQIAQADSEMEMILFLAESDAPEVHLFFRRSEEPEQADPKRTRPTSPSSLPGSGIPPKMAAQSFPLSPHQDHPLPPYGEPAEGGGVRTFRPPGGGPPGLAHVLLVGPHGHGRHGFQPHAPAPVVPQFRVRHPLPQTEGPDLYPASP